MNILALAFGIASLHFVCPLQAQTRDAVNWTTFESTPGRYQVAFPRAPVMKQGKLRTEIGDVVSVRHSAGDGSDATYDVTYTDYPGARVAGLSAATLLETVRDGLVYQAKGKLISDKPFTIGKVSGREQEIVGGDGMRYRIRLLLVERRLYQLTAMARPPAQPDERKFFGSFQLTGVTSP